MAQYRFSNGAVDSICSVPQYNLHSQPPATSVGQVVGTVNNNVLVIRYADDKYFHYDSHFFSQEKIVPLGTFQQGGFGFCNEVTFLFFRAGIAYDFWANGFQSGATCDMSHLVQQNYLSYDFSFDPRAPVETVYQFAPDTVLREYNGYLTSDTGIKKSKAVFVDSTKSLVYLFNDTMLAVYSLSFATVFSKQLPKPSPLNSRLNIRYNSIGRRLVIENAGTLNAASTKIKLFSLNGALLHAQEIGPWNIVPVPDGIRGIILLRVDAANKRMERKMIIVK